MISTDIGEIVYMLKDNVEKIKTIVIIILILLLLGGGAFYGWRMTKLEEKMEISDKLNASLTDTLRTVRQENGLIRNEKLAMQADIKDLEKSNITLTKEKKELLSEVKRLNKEKTVIAATVIKQKVQLDSLTKIKSDGVFVDSTTVDFPKTGNDTINYNIKVRNVARLFGKTPSLEFQSLEIPNSLTVAFAWDETKRKDYPVSVSVINTNPLFKTANVEAYAIPELQKDKIDPTFWQKLGQDFKKTKNKGLILAAGIAFGFLIAK